MTTIAGIATGNSDFSILVAALQVIDANIPGSDLIGTLSDPTVELTVFAPNNAAFGSLAQDLGYTGDPANAADVTAFLAANVDPATLQTVVLYHVSPGVQTSADVAAATEISTLQGGTIGVDLPTLVDKEPDLIDPSLVALDIPADNGIVHVIDKVLLPIDLPGNDAPTLTGIVAASGGEFDADPTDFDILLNAVTTAGLAGALDDPNADLTVFAPTDQAFVDLAGALGYSDTDEAGAWQYLVDSLTVLGGGDPIPLLTQILTYHVAGESLQASQVLSSAEIATLQGGNLGVNAAEGKLVDADPDVADPSLIATDIQAANGVAHVIDGVLLPVDVLPDPKSDLIVGDDGNDFEITGKGDDFVATKGGNDIVKAGSGNDVALGGEGRDLLFMGRGDDLARGGDDADYLNGGRGEDMLFGDDGHDFIDGGRDDDMLFGGEGDDFLRGGRGDDVIEGGLGNDLMKGGKGADTFVYGAGDGADVIRRFEDGEDQIDLSGTGYASLAEIAGLVTSDDHRTVIEFDAENQLRIDGLSSDELDESDFIF